MPKKHPEGTIQPPDHEQRQRILEELDRTLLVEAAAGTGKTTSLVGRMVALIREGKCSVDTMAAITFTRKAAAELRSRFQIELERGAKDARGEPGERLAAAVSHIERCFIGTIHSFCGRLLRERPIEAGINLAFEEMDEDEDFRLRELAWDDYVAALYAGDSPVLDELRELGLDTNQLRKSFSSFADYPDVEGWPFEEIELGDLSGAREDLEEYARHMESLLPSFPIDPGTDTLMPKYGMVVRMVRNRNLHQPSDLMAVLEVFKPDPKITQKCWPGGGEQAKGELGLWNGFAANIALPLVRLWREKRYAAVIRVFHQAVVVYNRYRAGSGGLNFQDLLMGASRLLRDKPQIRRYFRARFTHLLVDEFQDTDPIQAEVMMYLTASDPTETDWRKCTPVPGALFVVGDPKQSIYRFRRADIVTYNQVKEIIENSGGSVVSLSANFRTLGDLVWWGNNIFDKTFPDRATPYSPASSVMQIGRPSGTDGELRGIKVIEVPPALKKRGDAVAFEADFIARYIRRAIDTAVTIPRSQKELDRGVPRGATAGDFMIVTRTKTQLALYAEKFQELGIPHQVSGGSALSQIGELKLLIDCLRAVVEPENPVWLVAVLRGDLFGLSDRELYSYKRAGGRFSYRSDCPEGLDEEVAHLFREAYTRLRRYDLWLKQLPAVPAIERIAADLGLPMRALTRPGGDVRAGSIAKVFQVLRAAGAEFPSVADLTQYLADLIEQNTEFDSVPARAHLAPVVRLMNLHKVKGLEAPVVFLADPHGKKKWPVNLHIDRSGRKINGYIAVYDDIDAYHPPLLACPPGWEEYQEEEKRFEEAEQNRLLYVAATRAGTQLVITRKAGSNTGSYWDFFSPYLEDAEILSDPGPREAPAGPRIRVTGEDVDRAATRIAGAWEPVTAPTYVRAAAKEISVGPYGDSPVGDTQTGDPRAGNPQAEGHLPLNAGEHGTEWGTVIHVLLETAMKNAEADLEQLARAVVEEQGLEASYAPRALETVGSVMKSEIWERAAKSEKTLVEVPFTICRQLGETGRERSSREEADADRQLPMVLSGAIDLVFKETDGWVIVDYKSDAVEGEALSRLADHYRPQVLTYSDVWQEITGEPVKESGLYFTCPRTYVTVQPESG